MTREIKFRVWAKKQKRMIELFSVYCDGRIQFADNINQTDFVLMQYTGLKDKNGVEIFEGDIIRSVFKDGVSSTGEGTRTQEVFFNNKYMCLMLRYTDGNKQEYLINKEQFDELRDYKIIGNIYQNKDLIK